MDLLALAVQVAFLGALGVTGGLLLLTYGAFVRMNRDVRRARMFLMADRVGRFLGAFTFGFLMVAVAAGLSIAGTSSAAAIFTVVIFLFLGAVLYGSLELFLIVRPRRSRLVPGPTSGPAGATNTRVGSSDETPAREADEHAAR